MDYVVLKNVLGIIYTYRRYLMQILVDDREDIERINAIKKEFNSIVQVQRLDAGDILINIRYDSLNAFKKMSSIITLYQWNFISLH